MYRRSRIAVFLGILFLCIPAISGATIFFMDGFEYSSQGAFESVWATSCPGRSSVMGPSSQFFVSPSRSLRSVQNGGDPSCYVSRPYPSTTHVFYRWYLHLAPGYDLERLCSSTGSCPGGNGSKLMYGKAYGAAYDTYFFLEPYTHVLRLSVPHGGYSVMCPSGPGMPKGPQPNEECVFEPNKANIEIVPGKTYCIETELVRSSPGVADGIGRIWINGTLTLEYTNIPMARSDEGNSAFYTITYYDQAGYGTRYIDDIAVGDTRIGCSGNSTAGGETPPPAPTTPPASPTGLVIR